MTQYLTGHQEDCDLLKPHVALRQVTMYAPDGPYKAQEQVAMLRNCDCTPVKMAIIEVEILLGGERKTFFALEPVDDSPDGSTPN